MFKKTVLYLFFLLGVYSAVSAQNSQITSVIHNQHIINSTILGEKRSILVRVPTDYAKGDKKYPVIYMLDGHGSYLSMMPGILENQAWGRQIPEMILVSIQNTDRRRDLTPTDQKDKPGGGGSDKFLQFIESEVMPMIEKNYRTEPYRIFAGHSYGGLSVIYSLITRPQMFNAYIAASPYLQWDGGIVVKRAEEVFKPKKDWRKTIFITLGDEPDYVDAFNSFKDLLDKTKPQNLDYAFERYMDEVHLSTVLRTYYAGLRKIYAGWRPSRMITTAAEMENHYKKLSKKYGYEVKMLEDELRSLATDLVNKNKLAEAIDVYKRNIELFPDSLLSYGALGQTYEKAGRLKDAKVVIEKGYKLAEIRGEKQLLNYFKSDLERVSAKLKAN
jgi:uncharacterized protein